MSFSDTVRENPRLKPVVTDVVDGFAAYLADRPNARVVWVEEYARGIVHGATHRVGLAAITADSIVLAWQRGLLFRSRSHREITRDEVTAWHLDSIGLTLTTVEGEVKVEFRPGSPEAVAFTERLALIRPFGSPR